ncbi:hypothetical protein PN499_15405 [Kamptonema animale CS-326]|jgi:hypothetical protein|uniref:hypothetical protein n=1 Tax=Kamptonema animale TaxID=92934 RepID=UPI00232F4192|nr:hypothetical protein [Kamptonema animale]MDB9512578.1 hypothetical protein [Kamptonema animale CS-326]
MMGNIDIEKFVVCLRDIIILIAGLIVLYILLFNDRLAFTIAGSLITISSQWLLAGRGKKQEHKKIATFLIPILEKQINHLSMIEAKLMSVITVINKNNQMGCPYTLEEEQRFVIEKKANIESVKNYCEKCKQEMESDYRILQNKTEIYALDIAAVIVLYVNQVLNYICFLKPDECGDIERALITIRSYRIDSYSTAMKLSQEVFINKIIFNSYVSRLKYDYKLLYQLKCDYEKQGFDSDCESIAMEQIEKLLKDYGQEI